MRFTLTIIAGLFLLPLAAGPARADKAGEAIDKAKSYYDDKRYARAARELQYAISLVSKKLRAALIETLPPAPSGWRARPVKAAPQASVIVIAGHTLTRRYNQDGGRGRITAQLIVDNPLLSAMAALFNNPALAAAQNYERTRIDGIDEDLFIKYDADRKEGEIVLLIAARVFIKLRGRNIDGTDVLKTMMAKWNVKRLKKIAEVR